MGEGLSHGSHSCNFSFRLVNNTYHILMRKIAVLVNCRVDGNPNCGLTRLLESIKANSINPDMIEIHIKFDTDDRKIDLSFINKIERMPLFIHWIREPRGRGYIDIHHGYNRLLIDISPSIEIIGAMGDDFLVAPGWDKALLDLYSPNSYMIIHQRPHPPSNRPDFASEPFHLNFPVFEEMENLYVVDEAPFWSRKLIFATTWLGGGLSFTDGWTLALEHLLWINHGIRITRFTDKQYIHRTVHPIVDTPKSPRWKGDRARNFEYIRSSYFRAIVENQAENVARRVFRDRIV